jgi:hypothetical protein
MFLQTRQHQHQAAAGRQQEMGSRPAAAGQQQQQVGCKQRAPCFHPLPGAQLCHPQHQQQQQQAAAICPLLHQPMCPLPHPSMLPRRPLPTCRRLHQTSATCRQQPQATRCPACPACPQPTRLACHLQAWRHPCPGSPSSSVWQGGQLHWRAAGCCAGHGCIRTGTPAASDSGQSAVV